MSDTLITAEANKKMFDKIASRYDLTNKLISLGLDRRWRKKAVGYLSPSDDESYLDVGCGTGDVMLEVLRQCPASKVWGVDPAEKMLDIAKSKFSQAQLEEQAKLIAADACELPFDDCFFDGIISAFCFRNISDRKKALSEAQRTISPGGRLVLLELTVTDSSLLAPLYWFYSRCIIPVVGRLTGNVKAYRYLADSIYDFSSKVDVLGMMRDAGFSDVKRVPLNNAVVTIFVGQRT
jgi:demethylmenaquinone methyltransferase/2-methoxy-6-polyprenyl-1,4-benzoquinol methylase